MKFRPSHFGLALTLLGGAGFATAQAETFILKNGDKLEGTVVFTTRNTLSIKLPGRGMQQVAVNAIDQIEMVVSSGEGIAGTLVGWSGKAFEIQVGQEVLSVRDGEIIQTLAADPAPVLDVTTDEKIAEQKTAGEEIAASETAGELSDGVGGPRIALVEPGKAQKAVAVEDDPGPAAVTESLLPSISAKSLPTDESAGEITFELTLSASSDYPIAVIYSALDGSATNGADYQQQAGVLTIKAGATSAEVRIPLIDDDEPEPDEQFELFLSVDPKAVTTASRNIIGTIQDDDS